MNDHELDLALADLGATRVRRLAPSALRERVGSTPLPSTTMRLRPRHRSSRSPLSMFGLARLVAGAVVVALFGGLVLAALTIDQQASETPAVRPSSSPDRAPAIHWQTEVVDFAADSFTLYVNGLTFTTEGSALDVTSDPGDTNRWTLEVIWFEHGVEQRLFLYFGSDGREWWVDEIRTYDGHAEGEWVYATGPLFRTPMGEPFAGDLDLELVGDGRPDDPGGHVRATLAVDGLRLAASPSTRPGPVAGPGTPPQAGSIVDDFLEGARDLGRGILGRTRTGSAPIADGPSRPVTETVEYGGAMLSVEPLGDGLMRVLGDGSGHALDKPIMDIAIAPDGTVWVADRRSVFGLGRPGGVSTDTGGPRIIHRLEATPDGTLLVRGGWSAGGDSQWAALDGQTWTAIPNLQGDPIHPLMGVSSADSTPALATDGSLWRGVQGGAGRLDETGWTLHRTEDVAPSAIESMAGLWGGAIPTPLVAAAPDGSVWVAVGASLSRYDGASWREYQPLEDAHQEHDADVGHIAPIGVRVGPDGTVWALWSAIGSTSRDQRQYLVRYQDSEWDVFPLDEVAPGSSLKFSSAAVDDAGAVILKVTTGSGSDGAGASLVRFDGVTTSTILRLPDGGHMRIAGFSPDGSLWLVGGGSKSGQSDDRVHVVASETMADAR
jgi:hypothetical protein